MNKCVSCLLDTYLLKEFRLGAFVRLFPGLHLSPGYRRAYLLCIHLLLRPRLE